MIVDDDKDDRMFFCHAVREIGPDWKCWEAKDGQNALDQLKKAERLPDFIFLDLNMPLMDGKECLAELKKNVHLCNIPVIIYSTSDYEADIRLTSELGAAHYLKKVSDIYTLPQYILEAIKIIEK
jgi:CheY-like chemotaxis protein